MKRVGHCRYDCCTSNRTGCRPSYQQQWARPVPYRFRFHGSFSDWSVGRYHDGGTTSYLWLWCAEPIRNESKCFHDDVIKWKHFPSYRPFVRGIHRSPVNSLHKGQWRGALMFSLIYAWINGWVNNRQAGDFRRHHTHYDVIVMLLVWRIRLIETLYHDLS